MKKFFVFLFSPSTLIFIFLLLVSIYVILEKRRGRRRLLLFLALFFYYFFFTPFLPYFLLKFLETKYSPPPLEKIENIKTIVVLPARIYGKDGLSVEERFSRETLVRFLKAIEIKKEYPDKEIIILGGSFEDKNGKGATYLKLLAKKFNLEIKAIDTPLDTLSSAKALKDYFLKNKKNHKESFLLLTSAYHLPRAMYLFQKEGLNPVPYPANYNYKLCRPTFSFREFFPDELYLELTNMAVHEYLGLIFYKIKYFVKEKAKWLR